MYMGMDKKKQFYKYVCDRWQLCHKMLIYSISFPNMEQADKERKHLSEITNTSDKQNNRVSNGLFLQ